MIIIIIIAYGGWSFDRRCLPTDRGKGKGKAGQISHKKRAKRHVADQGRATHVLD